MTTTGILGSPRWHDVSPGQPLASSLSPAPGRAKLNYQRSQPLTSEVLHEGPAGSPAVPAVPGDPSPSEHGEELRPSAKKI